MWVVHHEDDLFVCFGAKPNKELGLEIKPEGQSAKNPREGSWQRNPERVSRQMKTQKDNRQRTAEETSGREIESRDSEEDGQR